MQYKFHAYGHPNIQSSHRTTLEFTKDEEVTLRGNCIVGVKADFEPEKLREFIKKFEDGCDIKIVIKGPNFEETIHARLNRDFSDDRELVIRKGDFLSERTLGIKADKASSDLKKGLIGFLKDKKNRVIVILEN